MKNLFLYGLVVAVFAIAFVSQSNFVHSADGKTGGVVVPLPDYIVNVQIQAPKPESDNLVITTSNIGSGYADAKSYTHVHVLMKIMPQDRIAEEHSYWIPVRALRSGERDVNVDYYVHCLKLGRGQWSEYKVFARADSTSLIRELNEGNNWGSLNENWVRCG